MVRTKATDADEQRVIDDVNTHGWHLVGIEDDPEGPGFVYSIGMFHTLGHPEIIIFGLSTEAMCQIVNGIGDEVRRGAKFQDWHESDQILDGYSCMFRTVPTDVYPEYLGYAMWFYRPEPFPVLQCVWPDKHHRYPWQSNCQAEACESQPILSQQIGWSFDAGKNRAVFTTKPVLDGTLPILLVSHDEDDDWQFLCGTTIAPKDGKLVCLSTIVDLHPALTELADLPEGWQATRSSPDQAWERRPITP